MQQIRQSKRPLPLPPSHSHTNALTDVHPGSSVEVCLLHRIVVQVVRVHIHKADDPKQVRVFVSFEGTDQAAEAVAKVSH